jgi:hypothetical protein
MTGRPWAMSAPMSGLPESRHGSNDLNPNARLAIGGPHAGAEAGNQATLFNFEVTYEE